MGYKLYLKKLLKSEKGNCINIDKKIEKVKNLIRWAHGYPDYYKFGMLCIGFQTVYFLLNRNKDVFCERFFLPENGNKVLTIETQTPLNKFDIISFTLPYEPLYPNILKILEYSNVPVFSETRKKPILIAGGVCPTYNPEPLAPFFDIIVIGECEKTIQKIVKIYRKNKNKPKEEILLNISKIDGIYVPSLYRVEYYKNGKIKAFIPKYKGLKKRIKRQWMKNINYETDFIVSPYSLHSNYGYLEIMRGCGRHCRFCMLGYIFRPPRMKSKRIVIKMAKKLRKFTDKLRLVAPSESEHPEIIEILTELKKMGFKVIVGSQRADLLERGFIECINNDLFTIAPEAGSMRLRKIINKNISDESIFKAVELVTKAKIPNFQLFFIVGFPFERKKDVIKIGELVKKVRKILDRNGCENTKLILNVNCHIKKPFTPFQWERQLDYEEYMKKILLIKKNLKGLKNVKIKYMEKKQLLLESVLVRGDRRAGKILYEAYKMGNTVKSWKKALELNNTPLQFYLRRRSFSEVLPWDIVDIGVRKEYLKLEYENSLKAKFTPPCYEKCRRCGVCK